MAIRKESYGSPTCPLALAHARLNAGGGVPARLNPASENAEDGPITAVTTLVMENGSAVGPGPVRVPLLVEVNGPIEPTGVPTPNGVFVLST
jgi:hypothetical protein